MDNTTRRLTIILITFTIALLTIILGLLEKTAVIPGLNPPADQEKQQLIAAREKKNMVMGSISDRQGVMLAWSKDEDSKRTYHNKYVYSQLLSPVSDGLETKFDRYLSLNDGTKDEQGKVHGANMRLTIDDELQSYASDMISGFKDGGSVVIMNDEGELLVLATTPQYDITTVGNKYDDLKKQKGVFTSNYLARVEPGSTLKILTGAYIIESGESKQVINDKGRTYVKGYPIHNAKGLVHGKVDFKAALVKSSNVYFIEMTNKCGLTNFENRLKDFKIGMPINLDFATLSSGTNFVSPNRETALAWAAIGQSVTISPVQLAMITKGIMTGEYIEPYLVDSIAKANGKLCYEGKTQVIEAGIVETAVSKKINGAMTAAATEYGLNDGTLKYKVAAKTGTAESADGKMQHATMITAIPADNPKYYVVVQQQNTKNYGKDMKGITEKILAKIIKTSM